MAAPGIPIETQARPAEPLLASQVISDQELYDLLETACSEDGAKKRNQGGLLSIGIKSLDDALGDGIGGGRVVGICDEAGAGGSALCRLLLARSLLRYPNTSAAVIDTTGNFDILRLYALLLAELQQHPELLKSLRSNTKSSESAEDVAAQLLDRVKIMRVFDFVGVREAVGEIRDELEGKGFTDIASEAAKDVSMAEQETPVVREPPKRTVVADSEDEDDDDEMLFEVKSMTDEALPAPHESANETTEQASSGIRKQDVKHSTTQAERSPVKFILIDNLCQILNPLLKKDYVQASALSSTFLHTLTNLTATHALHTLLITPTTNPNTPQNPIAHRQTPPPPPPPSIFASSTAIPSLMNLLTRYVDLNLLVTRMPRRKMDARVYYSDVGGGGGGGVVKKKRGVEMVSVLEVVGDRWEGRVGAWGAFVQGESGMVGVE